MNGKVMIAALALLMLPAQAWAQGDGAARANTPDIATSGDQRIGLAPGWTNAGEAISNLQLVAHVPRPEGFVNPANPGDFGYANSDLAFRDDLVFVGNFNGFQIYDISDPTNPRLRTAFVCPGGQGDPSVYGNLLFISVEEPRARIDCGTTPVTESVSQERFRGVRVFDISDLDRPVQVAAVQTCRGSHTHTLVPAEEDPDNVYIYVSGTAPVRPAAELAGCVAAGPEDPETAFFRIEVIQVPLAAPRNARVISGPRLFADPETGELAGLWPGGAHGPETQTTSQTNQCHDITAYPEIGLAAGACAGNGLLIDISDPTDPVRIAEVSDPNFAYWHSATFNNDGTKVIFTDEWGGGVAARCRAEDPPTWGANAIFTLEDGELELGSYYKLPVIQTAAENCVAHNGSIIPVPGRDIKAQAWYQGGLSVFDFTDAENPIEIAYFDRGPISTGQPMLGGHWSTYWYNGHIYGTEIARGLDVFRLTPSQHLSQNEIDAANLARVRVMNAQTQERLTWPASFVVPRAYLDQLMRDGGMPLARLVTVTRELEEAERLANAGEGRSAAALLERTARAVDGDARSASGHAAERQRQMAAAIRDLAASLR